MMTYFSVPKKEKIETIKLIFTKYKFIEEILTKMIFLKLVLLFHDGQVIIRNFDGHIGKIKSKEIQPKKVDPYWLPII